MDEPLTVRCACGWETTGTTEEVVVATTEHGEQLHNMSATREQILAMALAWPGSRSSDPRPT